MVGSRRWAWVVAVWLRFERWRPYFSSGNAVRYRMMFPLLVGGAGYFALESLWEVGAQIVLGGSALVFFVLGFGGLLGLAWVRCDYKRRRLVFRNGLFRRVRRVPLADIDDWRVVSAKTSFFDLKGSVVDVCVAGEWVRVNATDGGRASRKTRQFLRAERFSSSDADDLGYEPPTPKPQVGPDR